MNQKKNKNKKKQAVLVKWSPPLWPFLDLYVLLSSRVCWSHLMKTMPSKARIKTTHLTLYFFFLKINKTFLQFFPWFCMILLFLNRRFPTVICSNIISLCYSRFPLFPNPWWVCTHSKNDVCLPHSHLKCYVSIVFLFFLLNFLFRFTKAILNKND
jgi:hypothetical protein